MLCYLPVWYNHCMVVLGQNFKKLVCCTILLTFSKNWGSNDYSCYETGNWKNISVFCSLSLVLKKLLKNWLWSHKKDSSLSHFIIFFFWALSPLRFEISRHGKISLRCKVTLLLAFTRVQAKWKSLRCKFHFGQFDRSEISNRSEFFM